MITRPMFSRSASGELIRNYYCLDCGDGPFTQTDIDNHILVEKGYGKQTVLYCQQCCKIKFRTPIPETDSTTIEDLPIKEIPIPIEIPPVMQVEISFGDLSGREIINMVEAKTGTRITLSPKSKKAVLKHARRILEEKNFKIID
jgi:hypothetical protein